MSRHRPSFPPEPSRRSRLLPGGERTRRRILSAALRLISRNGFHGASIRAIARSVGLTEASIYYHFPSKQAIVAALYAERGITRALDELASLPGEVSLERQLAANAVASAHVWDENADFLRVVVVEVLRGDRGAQGAHQEMMDRWRSGIRDLLARYQARGEIDAAIDIAEAAECWVNLMYGTFVDRLLTLGRPSRGARFLTPELRQRIEDRARAFARHVRPGSEERAANPA